MATIVNARDVLLQAATPRLLGIQLGANVIVPGLESAIAATKEVSLAGSSQVFQVPKTGATSPASISVTGTVKNLAGTPTFTLISGTMSVTPTLTGGVFTFTPAQMTSDTVTFRLSLTVGATTYVDEYTVVKVREGADGIVGFLTNENFTLTADSLGNVLTYTGCSGNFRVFQGAVDVTTACTFSVQSNPQSLTGFITGSGGSAGAYGVTNSFVAGLSLATITFRATFGSLAIDKVFSLSKAKAGQGPDNVVVLSSNRDGADNGYPEQYGVYLSSGLTVNSYAIGHTLVVFNPATGAQVGSTVNVNTYTFGTSALIAAINAVAVGNTVCLYSNDATSCDAALNTCLADFGSAASGTWASTRVSHVFIGARGLLPGQAYEDRQTYASSGPLHGNLKQQAYFSASGIIKNGSTGSNGTSGSRGSQTFYVAIAGTSFSDATATATATSGGGPIVWDTVIQYNNSAGFSQSKYWNGSSWVLINAVVDGNLLVTGSVGARSLLVNNGSGNNLWWDANYQDIGQWHAATGRVLATQTVVSDGITGGSTMRSPASFSPGSYTVNRAPVTVGKHYRISVKARQSGANGTLYFRIDPQTASTGFYDYNNPTLGVEAVTVGTSWGVYFGEWVATTPYVGLGLYLNNASTPVGYMEAQDIRIEEMMDSALVVEGGLTADKINTNGLLVRDTNGNILLGSGYALPIGYAPAGAVNANITISGGALNGIGTGSGTAVANSSISITSGGVLQGAGGGTVTIAGLDNTVLRSANPITTGNIGTYISTAAIGAAYIKDLYVSTISTAVAGGATSGGRIEITTNRIDIYNGSNALRVRIGA